MPSEKHFPPRGPRCPDLRGKVGIVTGGGRGIGKVIAARLAREGVKVGLAGRTAETLEAAAGQIRAADGTAEAIPTDIGVPEQVDALFAAVAERLGPLDILVNNAAHMVGTAHTLERYDSAFYAPMLSDWRNFEAWQEAGAHDTTQRAHQTYRRLLEAYAPPPTPPDRREAMEAYIAKRKEEIREHGIGTD